MAQKGPALNMNPAALEAIIVATNRTKAVIGEESENIDHVCTNMEQEESLKGGGGDDIREKFAEISDGTKKIKASLEKAVKNLNDSLEKLIPLLKAQVDDETASRVKSQVGKAGVYKKD